MTKKFTAKSPDDLVPVARELVQLCAPELCGHTAKPDIAAEGGIAPAGGSTPDNGSSRSQHRPALVFLSGPLGAGKTKFVQTFVREASCSEGSLKSRETSRSQEVASPTFALHQLYRLPHNQLIHHFDLYRLESEDEIENVGLWDVLASRRGIVFIEWPEKLPGFNHASEFQAPGWSVSQLRFEIHDGGVRQIEMLYLSAN